jgi:Fe2+ or Zn2+ uptake regulation protein
MSDFREQLHILKQRATPARLAVLEALEHTRQPLSIDGIIRAVHGRRIDLVTIYRTVTLLKKIGLVRQVDFQHGHAHYELSSLGDHHHVVCVKCDSVADIPHRNATSMMNTALVESGFARITDHCMEFFGVCKKCAV